MSQDPSLHYLYTRTHLNSAEGAVTKLLLLRGILSNLPVELNLLLDDVQDNLEISQGHVFTLGGVTELRLAVITQNHLPQINCGDVRHARTLRDVLQSNRCVFRCCHKLGRRPQQKISPWQWEALTLL